MNRSFEIQCPPFDLRLSHWDRIFPHWGRIFPPSHAKRILCFSLPQKADKEMIISHLHIALHYTVQDLPFLAGSIVPVSLEEESHPWLCNIVPKGAARLDVKDLSDKLSFAALVESNFSHDLLNTDELYSPHKAVHVQHSHRDVCRFQANFIDGGLLIAVSVIHIVADGRGVTEIIKIFAEHFRKAQSGELGYPLDMTKDVYRFNRTEIVTGNGIPGSIEAHAAWTSTAANTHSQLVDIETSCCRTYRISAEALMALKNAAILTSAASNSWISTNDAISAFIWRSIMVARHRAGFLGADKEVHIAQPVDCRARLGLDKPYFGNVLYMTQSTLPFSDLADPRSGLSVAAQIIRAEIQLATAEQFRDIVSYAEQTKQETQTRMKIIDEISTAGIILTSHFKFGLYEIDFGPAFEGRRVKALRFPARGTIAGAVIVLPKLLDGSCEFMITEQKRTIDCFADDEIFCRFTAENKNATKPSLVKYHLSPPPFEYEVKSALDVQEIAGMPAATQVENNFNAITPPALNITTMQAPHIGSIRVIELNRPEAKNAISLKMLRHLNEEVEQIYHEQDISGTRVLILASALEDVFCAGADLKERMAMSIAEVDEFMALFRKTLSMLAALPIPTIAVVSGAALGGGLELALCCHFRIFSSNAIVGLPETRLGIIPGAGGTYRLPQIIGISHARDLILTGRRVGASEAFSMGLCNRLVNTDQGESSKSSERARCYALQAAVKLATQISSGAPLALQAAMTALSYGSPIAEKAAYASLLDTTDRFEGLLSFNEKRAADFVGE
ncbi:putative enoyl-CoA hydratase/isomerase family protein [Bisporella sp. PMI_857]|nr:putative enoyl-CoA hydratase/isomerase family protein [Bisporella sp. PMI_857]